MDQLDIKQRETIGKMSTARLIVKLIHIGHGEEELADMQRNDLLSLYAIAMASGTDKPVKQSAASYPIQTKSAEEIQIERERLTFEMHKFEEQHALEQEKIALERARMEAAREQSEIQARYNDNSLRLQRERHSREEERNSSLAARTKLFAQSVGNAMPHMPNDPVDIPIFFDAVEQLFKRFEVPADLQTILLNSHLTQKARNLLTRMDQSQTNDFSAVRRFVLEQFRLTPQEYRNKFNECTRNSDESNVLFANKLLTLLRYYVDIRGIKNIDTLLSCLVSDRLRSALIDYNCLRYICTLENAADKGWLPHLELARSINQYYANLPSSQ